jgi:hypothetical protein
VNALRYASRAVLGFLLLTSMFVVPMLVARGGSGLAVTIDHDPPDGPDPVTVGFDASFDITVTNTTGSPQSAQVFATTDGQKFVTWYPQDKWDCFPPKSTDFGAASIVHPSDLSGDTVECDRTSQIQAFGHSHLHLVVKAQPNPGNLELDVTSPDPASDTIQVVDKTGEDAAGFIPADGGKIKTDGKPDEIDDTNSVIKTQDGSGPGGVFELHDLSPGDPDYQDICGNGTCDGKVVEVEIPHGYTHRRNPPKLKLIYDKTAAGAGEDATIWIKKGTDDPQIVPECDIDGVAKPHPCHGPAHVRRNGDVRYTVYLLSGDPLCGKH